MSVTAAITAGPAAGMKELREALTHAGVVFMLDEADLAEVASALADPAYAASDKLVARGQPPTPGQDGFFEPEFRVGIQPGHIADDGTMDFFDRELLKPLARDQCVGKLHQPITGLAGRRVDGREIKVASAKPSKLQIGPSLRMAADGRAFALLPGVPLYVPERSLDVVQEHVHTGDVDLRSGNLDMQGALIVRGSVQRRFKAQASGVVEIQGSVESGSVHAGASVQIHGSVRGGDSGVVCAEGDVSARHAEAAYMTSGGVLKLETAINCQLTAAKIQITRAMRGGSAQAESSVQVLEAGSSHGAATLLAAGIPLERPLRVLRNALDLAKEQRALQHRAGGVRADGERAKGGKVGRAGAALDAEELARKAAIAARRQELSATARVDITGTGHAGVTIQIGVHTLTLDQLVTNKRFSFDSQKCVVRSERSV